MAGRTGFLLSTPHSRQRQSEQHTQAVAGTRVPAFPAALSPPTHPSHLLLSTKQALLPHSRAGAPVAWQGWVPGVMALSLCFWACLQPQPTVVTACLPWLREQSQNCVLMSPARTTRLGRQAGTGAPTQSGPHHPATDSVCNQTYH